MTDLYCMYVCMYVCTNFTPANIACHVLSQIILHIIILIISHLSAFVIILKYDFNFCHFTQLYEISSAKRKRDVRFTSLDRLDGFRLLAFSSHSLFTDISEEVPQAHLRCFCRRACTAFLTDSKACPPR